MVAAGAVVSLSTILLVACVLPFAQRWSDRAARIGVARERWGRLAALVASTDRLREMVRTARRTSAADEGQLVPGPTPALAASTLQEVVQRDASASAVQLERVDAAGDPQPGRPGLLAIPVQLQAHGDLYAFLDFMTRLEQGPPMLVVDELTVDAGSGGEDDDSSPSHDPMGARTLAWSVRLHGLYAGPPGQKQ